MLKKELTTPKGRHRRPTTTSSAPTTACNYRHSRLVRRRRRCAGQKRDRGGSGPHLKHQDLHILTRHRGTTPIITMRSTRTCPRRILPLPTRHILPTAVMRRTKVNGTQVKRRIPRPTSSNSNSSSTIKAISSLIPHSRSSSIRATQGSVGCCATGVTVVASGRAPFGVQKRLANIVVGWVGSGEDERKSSLMDDRDSKPTLRNCDCGSRGPSIPLRSSSLCGLKYMFGAPADSWTFA